MSKNTPFKICNEIIYPGESLSLALPLPEIYSCAPLFMPLKIIHGKLSGPCLLVTAAMHGNELNGTEIVNRLFNNKNLQRLSGTLILVPVLNVYGLINRSRHLPGGVDLNKSFPGSPEGSHAARMANIFIKEVFSHADCCIDLQTGQMNYSNLPQVYIHEADAKAKDLANSFNAPVISIIDVEDGTLSSYALKNDIPFLMYEAGEAMRFDEHAINVGEKGVVNMMQHLGMLPDNQLQENDLQSFYAQKNILVRASTSGISHTACELGQHIHEGQVICTINDPFGASDPVPVVSPHEGVIVGKNNLPLVHEGEGLFQLAVFNKMAHAATHLEDWTEKSIQSFDITENV